MNYIGYRTGILCLIFWATLLPSINCGAMDKFSNKAKGANMHDYNLGRFSISVPTEMKLDVLRQTIRGCEIQEVFWENNERGSAMTTLWNARVTELEKQEPPRGIKKAILDKLDLEDLGRSAKGVFYYSDNISRNIGNWYILMDAGSIGVSLNYWGAVQEKEAMLEWLKNIAKAYRVEEANKNISCKDSFSLRYGAIVLPFLAQESTYARLKQHPLDLKLEVDMRETHKVEQKDEGLLARTAAVIATGYATGVDIKRLRSKKRKVAGLEGEEEVDRMRDKYRTAISFGWRYAGKKNSGEYPEIVIRMESPDGNLEEKLKVWDAILDSMKPLYKQL